MMLSINTLLIHIFNKPYYNIVIMLSITIKIYKAFNFNIMLTCDETGLKIIN